MSLLLSSYRIYLQSNNKELAKHNNNMIACISWYYTDSHSFVHFCVSSCDVRTEAKFPVNTGCRCNVILMLDQRCRRRASIKTTLGQCIVLYWRLLIYIIVHTSPKYSTYPAPRLLSTENYEKFFHKHFPL